MIQLKRAYDRPTARDGKRFLVERLWPRGVRKSELPLSGWMKDVAPSTELRKWFGHDPERWEEFCERYAKEVSQHSEQLKQLRELAHKGPITLVYSAHDEAHNDAVALRNFILGRGEVG